MAHIFKATVEKNPQWDADMSVYQKRADNTMAHIAFIRSNYFAGDMHDMTITYAGDELHFHELHDALRLCFETPFRNSKGESKVIWYDFLDKRDAAYLRTNQGFYPIVLRRDRNGKGKIVVYSPFMATQWGLQHRELAVISVADRPWSYEIRLETLPETELLMAIFSLSQMADFKDKME